jgi:hypothetical protein
MTPLYPYFFNVDGFPEVQVTGLSAEQQGTLHTSPQEIPTRRGI